MSENGVTLVVNACRKKYPDAVPHRKIAELLSAEGAPITNNAIYGFEQKGYFPPDRAKWLAEHFELPVEKLINPRFGSLINNA